MVESATIAVIREHQLFDRSYYLEHNQDVASQPEIDPVTHYLCHGGWEGRDPHPLFDSSFYLEQNPYVAQQQINPLIHFLTEGARQGLDPHPLFSTSFYLEQGLTLEESSFNPLIHYLKFGVQRGFDPHPLFDGSFYLQQLERVEGKPVVCNPLIHYLTEGAQRGLEPSPSFDGSSYCTRYPDVAAARVNPLLHYVTVGQSEGRFGRKMPDTTHGVACIRNRAFHSALANLKAATGKKFSHLIVTGCLLRGGSERCVSNIARAIGRRIGDENVLILVTHRDEMTCLEWLPRNVSVVNLTQLEPSLSDEEKGMLLVELLVRTQPAVAIGINTSYFWAALDAHIDACVNLLPTKFVAYLGNYETFVYDNEAGFIDGPLRRLMKHLDLVVTDNNRLRDTTIAMYGSEPSIEVKLVTCYKGLDEGLHRALASQNRLADMESPDCGQGERRNGPAKILWASRIDTEKRPDVLGRIAQKLPDVQFDVYGRMQGTKNQPFLDNCPNITWMGEYSDFAAIPKDDKDLFLYTSQADSMPHVLVEAGACGLPIIAPDIGAIGELISEHTGWLIQRSDDVDEYIRVIKYVLDHPQAALARARNLAALIDQRYCWSAFTERFLALPIW